MSRDSRPPDGRAPSEHDADAAPPRYELLELLGEGRAGSVYRARDHRLDRIVALKLLRSSEPGGVERLTAEARAQARIDHEHVCRIFDTGELDGRPYVAMQLLRRATALDERAPSLELAARVELVEQAARAVAAAHAAGVTHRDLRPGNIMVEERGSGRHHAVVLDFGGAVGSAPELAGASSSSPGGLAFLAPEQVAADPASGDHRSDVYSLGATLYAVVAGQRPFFGSSRAETLRQIVEDEPLPLGLVAPEAPAELETIVHTAMAKDPHRRYQTVRELADDLRRWLDGKPVRALPARPWHRLAIRVRSRPASTLLIAVAAAAALAAAGSVLWQRVQEHRREAMVERYRVASEGVEDLLRRSRMMPLHDTSAAEAAARRRLAEVEVSLLEDGALARGPAYSALGRGYLLLRELRVAEGWLRAALEAGFDDPATASALGRAVAERHVEARLERRPGPGAAEIETAVGLLSRRGPSTMKLDRYLDALGHALDNRLEDALEAADFSARSEPWLVEARQLQGDLLRLRSAERAADGDLDAAVADLVAAGRAYREALETARSDARLWLREARRVLRQLRLEEALERRTPGLLERGLEAAGAAALAGPERASPLFVEARIRCLAAERLLEGGRDAAAQLAVARQLADRAAALEPQDPEAQQVQALVQRLLQESGVGAAG
ncbi:MAG TPA: serine/threonine-protein kinase [Methylomirabilota bacterium]|nr:serine/threonine-protein kinase [Methylomirabilota bacterium]